MIDSGFSKSYFITSTFLYVNCIYFEAGSLHKFNLLSETREIEEVCHAAEVFPEECRYGHCRSTRQRSPPKEHACVLLQNVLDYSILEIAYLIDSTEGGVKAALSRGAPS